MVQKIRKFLCRQEGVSFWRETNSGSNYFHVKDELIRVSDHITTYEQRPENLNIVIPANTNQFIVILNNRLIILPNYNKLKEYLKFYILTVGNLDRSVSKAIIEKKIVEVPKTVYKEVVTEIPKEVPVEVQVPKLVDFESSDLNNVVKFISNIHPSHYQTILNTCKTLYNSNKSKEYRSRIKLVK